MGIIGGVQAVLGVQKIKNGGQARLSIGQIAGILVNMPDAQKNLTEEQFEDVYTLYKQFKSMIEKKMMDLDGYLGVATKIVLEFDKCAPYRKFSGGDEMEADMLMEYLRETQNHNGN